MPSTYHLYKNTPTFSYQLLVCSGRMKLKALLAFALLLLLKLTNVANGESVDKIPSSIVAESGIKLSWCLKQIKFALESEKKIGKIIKK